MRSYFIAMVFGACTAASLPVSAQQSPPPADQLGTADIYCTVTDNPPADEVWVFADANYRGKCANLTRGFFPNSGGPYDGGFALANDSISSIKVGSASRATLFKDGVYGGSYISLVAGNYPGMPSGWNDAVSSLRVEDGSRSPKCDDLKPGEYALFRDTYLTGDCVVLHYKNNYDEPIYLGIANDSVSSVNGGPLIRCLSGVSAGVANQVNLFSDGIFQGGGSSYPISSGSIIFLLPNFNDVTSATESLCFASESP